jgi:hypothetical protein
MRYLIDIINEGATLNEGLLDDDLILRVQNALLDTCEGQFSGEEVRDITDALRASQAGQKRPTRAYRRGHADAMARRAIDPPHEPTARAEYMSGFEDARK